MIRLTADVMKFESMVYNQDWDGVIRQHEKLAVIKYR